MISHLLLLRTIASSIFQWCFGIPWLRQMQRRVLVVGGSQTKKARRKFRCQQSMPSAFTQQTAQASMTWHSVRSLGKTKALLPSPLYWKKGWCVATRVVARKNRTNRRALCSTRVANGTALPVGSSPLPTRSRLGRWIRSVGRSVFWESSARLLPDARACPGADCFDPWANSGLTGTIRTRGPGAPPKPAGPVPPPES